MLTIKDLKERIKDLPDDMLVLTPSQVEGTMFSSPWEHACAVVSGYVEDGRLFTHSDYEHAPKALIIEEQ